MSFLESVITTPEGWLCLATLQDKTFNHYWFNYPDQELQFYEQAQALTKDANVYFSPHLFSERQRKKVYVLPTRTIAADLDGANPQTIELAPTFLVQTSNNRYQAYWHVDENIDDELSRRLTYSIEDADRSGWPLGHLYRLPGTYNHKYGNPQEVKLVEQTSRVYPIGDFSGLPSIPKTVAKQDIVFLDEEPEYETGPQELLASVKSKLPARVITQYNTRAIDRSRALWALMCSAFRAGLNRKQVYFLAYHSANNKWQGLNRELAKDVLRAEVAVPDDAIEIINQLRKMKQAERMPMILDTCVRYMNEQGSFVRTTDGQGYYIPTKTGSPVLLTRQSRGLSTLLNSKFGLNPTEPEHGFCAAGIASHVQVLPPTTRKIALSFYDKPANTFMLHTGARDVIIIRSTGTSLIQNGSNGLLFTAGQQVEPFYPIESDIDWGHRLFSDHMTNLIGISSEAALALLKSWFLFVLFRNVASARPILALIGQPGSGKTTLFKKLFALLYGRQVRIGAVTSEDNFDMMVTNYPLAVFDNADTWKHWLADRLAQSAGLIDIPVRRLYTDDEVHVRSRTAVVGLSAHTPKFGREDVVDRMILLNFRRFSDEELIDESEMVEAVFNDRARLWGSIVNDIKTVLSTPRHKSDVYLRVSDFASLGMWFAESLGYQDQFRSAIATLKGSQKTMILEQDQMLVECLLRYATKQRDEYRPAGAIWMELETLAPDPMSFARTYKNAVNLAAKLWTMQDALKQVIDISWQPGVVRKWKITTKQ